MYVSAVQPLTPALSHEISKSAPVTDAAALGHANGSKRSTVSGDILYPTGISIVANNSYILISAIMLSACLTIQK